MRGLIISIYGNPAYAGCSNGGLSSNHTTATLVGDDIPGIFEETAERPAVRLQAHYPGIVRLVPASIPEGRAGPMFGGAFGYSSDSRFTEAVERLIGGKFYGAVALHDRFE